MEDSVQVYVGGVLDEIAKVVGAAPAVTINLMVGRLTDAYKLAESNNDIQSMELLVSVYDKVTALEKGVIGAVELAAAARSAAAELVQQRDEAAGALDELRTAVDDIDTDHPVVSRLVERISDDAYEMAYDSAWEDLREQEESELNLDLLAMTMIDIGGVPASTTVCELFLQIVVGVDSARIPVESRQPLLKELADYMAGFVTRWQDAENWDND
jgi:hypothetical protein